MTGSEAGAALLRKIGQFGSGYFDNTRLNSFFLNAVTDRVDAKVQQFQATQKVTQEMLSLIATTVPITPTNATIDISPTSVDVADFYSFIKLEVTSPYRETSLSRYAEERRHDQFIDEYTEGDARYPRYSFSAGILAIEPANATSVTLTYFPKPFPIDVTDVVTQIPYNDKFIQLIIDDVIGIIGVPNRDQFNLAVSEKMEQKNP